MEAREKLIKLNELCNDQYMELEYDKRAKIEYDDFQADFILSHAKEFLEILNESVRADG